MVYDDGWQRLIAMILAAAVQDAKGVINPMNVPNNYTRPLLTWCALEWINGRIFEAGIDDNGQLIQGLAFDDLCDYLGINPDYLRRGINHE